MRVSRRLRRLLRRSGVQAALAAIPPSFDASSATMRRSLARKTLTPYSFPSRAELCKRECKVCTRPSAEPARRGKRGNALFYRLV